MSPDAAQSIVSATYDALRKATDEHAMTLTPFETGHVLSVGRGVARVSGLPQARSEELLRFPDGVFGLAFNLDAEEVGVILLDHSAQLAAGDEVRRTHRVLDVPVGDRLLGRVIDPLGRPKDGHGPLHSLERRPCERESPAIADRLPVRVPLQTGIKVIDALFPLGRGQRELILGDRLTGKTAIAVDTIINQHDKDMICVYCAIGQRNTAIARIVADLRSRGAMEYTCVVVAEGDSVPGLQFVAPYAATTIAEYFMEQGHDVLIVYDDLTSHARSYRELSLLLRRPPGREAFPGDIFYLHSRLLERATHLSKELGGGSLTALPIAETEAQNVSAYIPTNLISITDGQIYLSPGLFQKGILPAVDVGRSVSRVGGKTQLKAYRAVAGDLRLSYSQFQELEAFSRFSSRLDDETRTILERGRRVREIFKQPQYQPLSVPEQIAVLVAMNSGLFDVLEVEQLRAAEAAVCRNLTDTIPEVCDRIMAGEKLSEKDHDEIRKYVGQIVEQLKSQTPAGDSHAVA